MTLVVPAPPDFTLASTPGSRTVVAGGTAQFTVTTGGALNGFDGDVALSVCRRPPSGASGAFSPGVVAGGAGSSVLTVDDDGGRAARDVPLDDHRDERRDQSHGGRHAASSLRSAVRGLHAGGHAGHPHGRARPVDDVHGLRERHRRLRVSGGALRRRPPGRRHRDVLEEVGHAPGQLLVLHDPHEPVDDAGDVHALASRGRAGRSRTRRTPTFVVKAAAAWWQYWHWALRPGGYPG